MTQSPTLSGEPVFAGHDYVLTELWHEGYFLSFKSQSMTSCGSGSFVLWGGAASAGRAGC